MDAPPADLAKYDADHSRFAFQSCCRSFGVFLPQPAGREALEGVH